MKYALVNGIILDGNENKPTKGKAILVDGERIVDVIKEKESYGDYRVVDLEGKYIMPGLVNLHVHMPVKGGPAKKTSKPVDYKKLFDLLTKVPFVLGILQKGEERNAKNELFSGVTTLRAVGGILNLDSKVRDKINEGKIIGPRMLVANSAISVPNGHFAGSLAVIANTPDEARKFVDEFQKDKPDLVKLMITGGVMDSDKEGEPGALRMQPEIVKAACEQAHKYGLPVAAHIECKEGLRVAVENGVDTIEHGALLDDKLIKLMKERDLAIVTTMSPVIPYWEFELDESNCLPVAKANTKIVMDGIIKCNIEGRKNDLKVGLGTDTGCPFDTHYNGYREMHYYCKYCKATPEDALRRMTLGNAEILHMEKEIGSIEKGKFADMIVSSKNPLEDFRNLAKLDKVIFKGTIHNNPSIKKDKKVELLLDKYM